MRIIVFSFIGILCVGVVLFVALIQSNSKIINSESVDYLEPSDILYEQQEYVINYQQDLQLPELPTGCEATALGTLLRLNDVDVTKIEVADAMPKNNDGEYIYSFYGNPFSQNGWACMAPCSVITAQKFLEKTGKSAVELKDVELTNVPLPCAVWVTIDLDEPDYSGITRNGYPLFYNTHCLVVTAIDENTVKTIDPLKGYAEYNLDTFEKIYSALGSQAVYIENT